MNFLKASSVKSLSWTPPSLWDYRKREAILNSGRVHPESISYGTGVWRTIYVSLRDSPRRDAAAACQHPEEK